MRGIATGKACSDKAENPRNDDIFFKPYSSNQMNGALPMPLHQGTVAGYPK